MTIELELELELELEMFVYHEDIYWGKEKMKIVGLRGSTVELEGDYSGGIHCVCQRSWLPISGVLLRRNTSPLIKVLQ